MTPSLIFRGQVIESAFVPDDRSRWSWLLAKLEGKRAMVTVGRETQRRSLRANAYLWVINTILSEHTGHTPDEIHYALKCKIFGHEDTQLGPVPKRRTRDLDSVEFADYVTRVKVEAAALGCDIPDPEEVA